MRLLRNLFSLVIVCYCLETSAFAKKERVDMQIYYESLCPHSEQMLRGIDSVYDRLHEHINIELIPFGKVTYQYTQLGWQINCQHGPSECYGNKVQACGLFYTTSQEAHVKFVHCIMTSGAATANWKLEQCATDADIPWSFVSHCMRSGCGDSLLALNGYKTNNVQPQITYIPTIVYNGSFNQTLQDNAMKNLFRTTCSLFDVKPVACN